MSRSPQGLETKTLVSRSRDLDVKPLVPRSRSWSRVVFKSS